MLIIVHYAPGTNRSARTALHTRSAHTARLAHQEPIVDLSLHD